MSEQRLLKERASDFFGAIQDEICAELERFDAVAAFRDGPPAPVRRGAGSEEEDSLFIG